MWQRVLAPLVEAGEIQPVGIVLEQHEDRARLYCQWKRLDWPIYVDSLDLVDHAVVPVPYLLDEAGVVRATRLRPDPEVLRDLLDTLPKAPQPPPDSGRAAPLTPPEEEGTFSGRSREVGERWFLLAQSAGGEWRADPRLDRAIEALRGAVASDPKDGRALFRLGVALRARADGSARHPGDAQEAVRRWGEALALDPNQYVWRRRLQQYGPLLDKPYDFYSWVAEARAAILARGETPVPLCAEPTGSELAYPRENRAKAAQEDSPPSNPDPDPEGRMSAAPPRLLSVEPVLTPAVVRPGDRVRVRLTLRVHPPASEWNDEGEPVTAHLDLPKGITLEEGQLVLAPPPEPSPRADRAIEAELAIAPAHAAGPFEVRGYALVTLCEESGVCRRWRREFVLRGEVDPRAVRIR